MSEELTKLKNKIANMEEYISKIETENEKIVKENIFLRQNVNYIDTLITEFMEDLEEGELEKLKSELDG